MSLAKASSLAEIARRINCRVGTLRALAREDENFPPAIDYLGRSYLYDEYEVAKYMGKKPPGFH